MSTRRRETLLVRHAQASFGAPDYDALSDLGHEQARVLGTALRERLPRVDRAVTGRMRRHRETAEGVLGAMGLDLPLEVDPGWDEYDHTDVLRAYDARYADPTAIAEDILDEENPARAFQRLFSRAVERWTSGAHDSDYTESWSAFRARVDDALDRLHASPAQTTLVFSSGGPILAACQRVLDVPTRHALRMGWALVNASVTRLSAGRDGFRLASFNEQGHFTTERLLTFR